MPPGEITLVMARELSIGDCNGYRVSAAWGTRHKRGTKEKRHNCSQKSVRVGLAYANRRGAQRIVLMLFAAMHNHACQVPSFFLGVLPGARALMRCFRFTECIDDYRIHENPVLLHLATAQHAARVTLPLEPTPAHALSSKHVSRPLDLLAWRLSVSLCTSSQSGSRSTSTSSTMNHEQHTHRLEGTSSLLLYHWPLRFSPPQAHPGRSSLRELTFALPLKPHVHAAQRKAVARLRQSSVCGERARLPAY